MEIGNDVCIWLSWERVWEMLSNLLRLTEWQLVKAGVHTWTQPLASEPLNWRVSSLWPLLSILSIFGAVCCVKSLSRVRLFTALWTVAQQAPLFMGFSRKEHWSGLTCPSPGYIPDPGFKSASVMSSALVGGFFTTNATWEALLVLFKKITDTKGTLHTKMGSIKDRNGRDLRSRRY